MLSRVSTTRRASLFLHPRISVYALAASKEVKHISGRAPHLCRDVNTGSHLLQAPCYNGNHGPVCKAESYPLAHHALCRDDAPVQAFSPKKSKKEGFDEAEPDADIESYVKLSAASAKRKKGHSSHGNVQAFSPKIVKKDGCGEAQQDADIQSYVKLSPSTARRKKCHSSHGNGKVSVLIDSNSHSSDGEVKVSESNAMPSGSKASRSKVHVSNQEVKVANSSLKLSCSSESKKTTVLSYGDVMVSESETRNQDANSDAREGDLKIFTCEACRNAQGDFGYCDLKATAQSTQLHSPSSSNDYVMLPLTLGQEEFPSSVPCVISRYNFEGGGAFQPSCCTGGFIAASTSKSKNNCVPSHVSNASSRTVYPYPSLPLQGSLIGTKSKGKKMSQVAVLELRRKVELLEAEKMSVNDAQALFKTMAFKSSSLEQLSAMLQVLKEFFGTGEKACEALANSSKKLLLHPVDLLQQKLKVLADFQIEKKTVSRLLTCRQALVSIKVEVLQKNLSFFEELGLTVEALNKMCQRYPRILSRSVENCVLPTLEFLESTELTKQRMLKLVRGRPRIFSNCKYYLIGKYKYFQQLGFSADILDIAFHYLHQFSIETLQANFQSIKDLGFSDEDVQFMVRKQPSLLSKNSESLRARYYYLVHEQNRDMAEVMRCPACLMYSLHGRIIPRFAVLNKLRLSRVYSLSTILCMSDRRFKNKFRVS